MLLFLEINLLVYVDAQSSIALFSLLENWSSAFILDFIEDLSGSSQAVIVGIYGNFFEFHFLL